MMNSQLLCTHLPPAAGHQRPSSKFFTCSAGVWLGGFLFDSPPCTCEVTQEPVPQALLGKCLESKGKAGTHTVLKYPRTICLSHCLSGRGPKEDSPSSGSVLTIFQHVFLLERKLEEALAPRH